MKKTILIVILSTLIFVACKQTKQGTVEDLISASNKFDKQQVGKFLSDNFIYLDTKEKILNKTEYLKRIDSLKNIDLKSEIISSQDLDSTVKTEESISTIFDTIMEGTSKIIQKKTYRFTNGKLKSITVDTTLNYDKYISTLNEKIAPILYYSQDQYDIQDNKEIFKRIKKYISEFGTLSQSDKNKYKQYSRVQGTYVSTSGINTVFGELEVIPKFVFKKEHCNFSYFGMGFGGKYTIEDDYVYIESGGELGTITLKIVDNKTLDGEGWIMGTYKRVK